MPAHFCTTASDLVADVTGSISGFRFLGWLVVEINADDGMVGIGNAALAPHATKATIDPYLKPLLIGTDPLDIEYLWQHMYRRTLPFGRKGIAMAAISAVDLALWDARQVAEAAGLQAAGRPHQARICRSTPAGSTASRSTSCTRRRRPTRTQGFTAVKLRFGWGPTDGAARHAAQPRSGAHHARSRRRPTSTSWPTATWAGTSNTPSGCCRARAVPPALGGGAGHRRRHRRLRRAARHEPRPDLGRRARIHAVRFQAGCWS